MTDNNILNVVTDRQVKILAVVFEVAIISESLCFALEFLSSDARTNNLEKEMRTVSEIAAEARENLRILQDSIWQEFGVNRGEMPPANDPA